MFNKEHCGPQAGNVQQKGGLKVQRWCFGVFRVFGVFGVQDFSVGFKGLLVRFNFGFGWTKTTRNVTWGSILTPCRKNA